MCRSKKLLIAFYVCVSIKTICIASLLQEQEQELNENYYLGDENGFLIVNGLNVPFKFKLYPQNNHKEIKKENYIETNLYYKGGNLIINKNNEIICELVGREIIFAIVKKDEKEIGTIECELFKTTNPNNLKLVFVEDNKKVEFNEGIKVTFSLLPHNYPQYNIKFIELKAEGEKTLTNTEGHPLLAYIENNEIIIFYKKEGEGCFNAKETIPEDERFEVKLVKEDSSIKTKIKDCCCCFSWCF